MKKATLVFLVLVLCSSCVELGKSIVNELDKTPESTSAFNYNTVGVEGSFKIDIPIYMKTVSELNPEAVIQYGNIYKETYFIIIQEDKQDYIELFKEFGEYDDKLSVIDNYKNAQKSLFHETISNAKIQEYGLDNINGRSARQIKIFGEVDGIDIAYIVAFIESDNDVFMLMNWTIKDRIAKYENSFEYINGSFKLTQDLNEVP